MHDTGARGLAIGIVRDGRVARIATFGVRNAAGDALGPDTVMYGASLTKAVFGYMTMQLVDEGRLGLDRPIADILPRPLPAYDSPADSQAYSRWGDLVGDDRWRAITPRILLSHRAGFANFHWLEPDERLRLHFDPGSRYAYSGDGMLLLQFVIERGLGLDAGAEMNRRVFEPLGMRRTSMKWREDFRPDVADGFAADGSVRPHDERSRVRAAGSMDTSIADMTRFAAAYVRGERLSAGARREMVRRQHGIDTRSQFPTLQEPAVPTPFPSLGAALGVLAFDGPRGPGFYKGGHDDVTANTWVCVERTRDCVVILSNDVRAERAFPELVRAVLGDTGVPWRWEYGDVAFWAPQRSR